MRDTLRESYEAFPYESNAITTTQIGSLEAVSLLHGLRPTPANRCRVLELGCASGGNILPMAYRFPHSRFIGVDFADNQVRDGIRQIEELGISNVELRSMSITEIGPEFGLFDYIICHGVFSWVPDEVQEAILRVSADQLAPNGVAYVSYNTYPGWHARELLREMLMFHDDPALPPRERVARARAFGDRLSPPGIIPSKLSEAVLLDEVTAVRKQGDAHLLHEQLEPFNRPVYFSEFASRASEHGLRFVCESKLFQSGWEFDAAAQNAAGTENLDTIRFEQYRDFVRSGTFRRTLLCHDSHIVQREPSADAIPELSFVGTSVSEKPSAEDVREANGGHVAAFRSRRGDTIATFNPVVTAALRSLNRVSPRLMSFPDLLSQVTARVMAQQVPGLPGEEDEAREVGRVLPEALLHCARTGLVDVDRHPPVVVPHASTRPVASPLARARAAGTAPIPTLLHGQIKIGSPERFLLARLDGSRTRSDLLAELEAASDRAEIVWPHGRPSHEAATTAIDEILNFFATNAILEA